MPYTMAHHTSPALPAASQPEEQLRVAKLPIELARDAGLRGLQLRVQLVADDARLLERAAKGAAVLRLRVKPALDEALQTRVWRERPPQSAQLLLRIPACAFPRVKPMRQIWDAGTLRTYRSELMQRLSTGWTTR